MKLPPRFSPVTAAAPLLNDNREFAHIDNLADWHFYRGSWPAEGALASSGNFGRGPVDRRCTEIEKRYSHTSLNVTVIETSMNTHQLSDWVALAR